MASPRRKGYHSIPHRKRREPLDPRFVGGLAALALGAFVAVILWDGPAPWSEESATEAALRQAPSAAVLKRRQWPITPEMVERAQPDPALGEPWNKPAPAPAPAPAAIAEPSDQSAPPAAAEAPD